MSQLQTLTGELLDAQRELHLAYENGEAETAAELEKKIDDLHKKIQALGK